MDATFLKQFILQFRNDSHVQTTSLNGVAKIEIQDIDITIF